MLRSPLFALAVCFLVTACATRATPEDAQMANALCTQGKTLLASGKNDEARDIYLSAVYRDDNNARAWNGLGVSYDLLGKQDKAQDAYQHAVEADPHDLTALNNLAHLYLEKGDSATAIHLLEPYAHEPDAPLTLKQNLAVATKSAAAKEVVGSDIYADLGSYPTDGMAQGHVKEAKSILGSSAIDLSFVIVPEMKVTGGTPVFTIKVVGKPPQDICDTLNAEAIPCITHNQ